jgi:hypothetical protein
MNFNPEIERMKTSATVAKVEGSRDGTPNLVSLTKALLANLMEHIRVALDNDEYPHCIEVSHTWSSGGETGAIAGGRLTLTMEALNAEEYAEAIAQFEQAQAEEAGQKSN